MSLSGIAVEAAPSSAFGPAGTKSVGKLGGASVLGATWLNLLRNSCSGSWQGEPTVGILCPMCQQGVEGGGISREAPRKRYTPLHMVI